MTIKDKIKHVLSIIGYYLMWLSIPVYMSNYFSRIQRIQDEPEHEKGIIDEEKLSIPHLA